MNMNPYGKRHSLDGALMSERLKLWDSQHKPHKSAASPETRLEEDHQIGSNISAGEPCCWTELCSQLLCWTNLIKCLGESFIETQVLKTTAASWILVKQHLPGGIWPSAVSRTNKSISATCAAFLGILYVVSGPEIHNQINRKLIGKYNILIINTLANS